MHTTARPVEILLVEDSPTDVLLTRDALEATKVQINLHVADNGAKGLAFLRQQDEFAAVPRPDLVLLDLNLPGKSGFDVLREAKADQALRQIPIVVLSASRAEQDVARSYDDHANCYIAKPVGVDGLRRVMRSFEEFWLHVATLPLPLT